MGEREGDHRRKTEGEAGGERDHEREKTERECGKRFCSTLNLGSALETWRRGVCN